MRDIMKKMVQFDEQVSHALVLAMREVAAADGNHPRELALIESFEQGLGSVPEGHSADLAAVNTPALKEAFIKTLILVAFADTQISDPEAQVIREYADKLELGERELSRAISDVAAALLSNLSGVKATRDQAKELGRKMGLDEFTIDEVLGDD